MHQNIPPDFIKFLVGGIVAITSWGAGKIAQAVSVAPDWVKAADTPIIVLAMGYAVIHLWRALKATNDARIADQVKFIETLRQDAVHAAASREKVVESNTVLVEEFKALRRSVESTRQPLYQYPPKDP